MQVCLSDEHDLLVATVDALAADLAPGGVDDLDDPTLDTGAWRSVVELGLVGLHLPEDVGGGGAGAFEAALVVERLAHGLCTLPVLGAMLAADALAASGRDDLLGQLLAGEAL
ncbi:MAG: acyl-CoA dehydrogenase family protein, partial [Acidimicrobiales bacterium]|nr:acyl-CoA dehydrogenase family protein [Acidimicrobiales bacterium]